MMFYVDDKRHHRPHIHAQYAEYEALIAIDNGDVLEGDLPRSKMRLALAWIEIHYQELMDNWHLAVRGRQPAEIEPLR